MDKLKAAKAKSFCAGCKRRGHWHKDAICPLNRGSSEAQGTVSSSATTGSTARTSGNTKEFAKAQYPCHVVHVTWEIEGYQNKDLLAITDTACSRSVAGAAWVDTYVTEARRLECDPQFTSCREAFKFGASKVFVASYGILLCFEMGGYKVGLKVAVVNGDVPLLVSRGALGKMGMLLDVAENRATFKALGVKDLLLETTETGHPAFQIKPSPLPKAFVQGPEWDSSEIKIVPQAEPYMSARASRGLCDDGDDGVDASTSSGSRSCLTSWMVYVQDEVMKNDGTPFPRTPRGKPALDYVPLFYSKRVGIATRNLLLDVNFNPETFAAWWSSTNISNDFWIEDEDFLVRVHVIPRRSFFSPMHWRSFLPYMVCGVSLEMSLLSLFFGSEGVSFVDDDQCLTLPHFAFLAQMASSSDLLTAPIVTRPKTLSEFTKAELLAEARARNLWINEKWTAVELRSAIQEDRRNPSANHPANATKGMSAMTLDQLKARALELGYHVPPYGTRGTIMRILRDQGGMSSESILGFGRYAGKMFKETPLSYRTWALREVESNDNPSEDLVMFANWWQGELHRWNDEPPWSSENIRFDPEVNATVPYVEDASSTASWDVLQREALAPPMTPQAKAKAASHMMQVPRTPARRRPADGPPTPTATRMDQDLPTDVNEEVRYLEERLAVLKDQHGIPP
ncbi:GIP [Symbiodinium sp. CCMP2456]|nr:GIP [Symbiodinium sp. CCMP2456]